MRTHWKIKMFLEKLNENNMQGWEKFVEINENIPPQYLISWKKAIEKSYSNCKPKYFLDLENEEVNTIAPFFLVKSKIFGNRLISQPFLDFGGPRGKWDESFLENVIEELKDNSKEKLKHIEIRLNKFLKDYEKIEEFLIKKGFKKEPQGSQIILELAKEEEIWEKFDRITKKGINKANKSELELKEISNKKELDAFYKLYFKKMKNFGTPQHSKKFFENLQREMKENFKGLNCYKEGKLIASLIVFCSRDCMYAAYNFSESPYLKYQPNDLLHWEMIKEAIKREIKYFDFGLCDPNAEEGSHAAGIYRFKKKWEGKLYEKVYFYYSLTKDNVNKKEEKSKYKKMISVWKMIPSPILNIIGPKICSQLAL